LGATVLLAFRCGPRLSKRLWAGLFSLVLAMSVSALVTHCFLALHEFMSESSRASLTRLMDGTADRPFVYRRLAPDLVRAATDRMMARIPPDRALHYTEESPINRYRLDPSLSLRTAVSHRVAYFFIWLSLTATFLCGAALVQAIRGGTWLAALATATVVVSLLPIMFTEHGYLYDFSELFLWTALLLCVVRRWWVAVPILFGLMLANKESAALVVPALFPLFFSRLGAKKALIWTGVLGAGSLGWLAYVRTKYALLPGTSREWWLPQNFVFWTTPSSYLKLKTGVFSPGLYSPAGANVIFLVLLLIPLRFGWKRVAADWRWATVLLSAVLLPLFFVSGFLDEIRALSLLYPLLLVICLEGTQALFATTAQPLTTGRSAETAPHDLAV
jgi:hypothetical protein